MPNSVIFGLHLVLIQVDRPTKKLAPPADLIDLRFYVQRDSGAVLTGQAHSIQVARAGDWFLYEYNLTAMRMHLFGCQTLLPLLVLF